MLKKFGAVLYIIPLIFFGQTVSACVTTGNEALQVYCFLNELEKQPVSRETATEIDKKLKSQGYKNGLGLGFKNSPETLSVSVSSSVSFDSNLNGGNPKGPLILGGLTFQTDPNLEKKSGVLIGGQIDTAYRKSVSEGKYISINAGFSRLYNAKHNLVVGSEYGKICSINIIPHYRTSQTLTPPSNSAMSATRSERPSEPPRLSMLRRTSGSVLERRRLKRQSAKARLTPSVSSSDSALSR